MKKQSKVKRLELEYKGKRERGKRNIGEMGNKTRAKFGEKKHSEARGSKGIKKIRKYGIMNKELLFYLKFLEILETFEYNINVFAFVQLTQLLHKFCACLYKTILS